MAKFKIEVARISYASRIIEIEADTEEQAKEKAIDEAGNYEFSEHDADYKTEWIKKIE